MNKSKSATDPVGESKHVGVRSLSVSEPLDIELRRYQRKLEHPEHMPKRHDSPSVISTASYETFYTKKRWNNSTQRKSRGRSKRRFYETSVERFPPASVTKSRLRVIQEMPFWRLDANRFRRTVSSFETREKREARWRQSTLQDMPFSHYPWKKIHNLFEEPNSSKIARRRLKHAQKMKSVQLTIEQRHRKASQENPSTDPKTKLRQRPHSTSAKITAFIEGGVEIITDTSLPEDSKLSPSPVITTETPITAKPPVATRPKLATKSSTSTISGTTPNSIRTRIGGSDCQSCERKAYRAESVEALGQVFHSSCFRCAKCSRVLQRSNWNHKEGKFYCNPCHRRLSLLTFRH
ncbi:Cysteine and glycine-rich protein 1 [Echinococcus granulosus]|uniref:Cysteine and glycine-rich protein n=1 Tax=Echinococcus granulosus TaxID=6210 RepID=U6JIU8_ECHGR|nr:Cysteine and glycine-rich protein [Echinococcus granulosus]EUB55442.1 Cysteine and glycine-rich protein [Echinococcus granulosus]KAH9285093.1 Cysteine and glycine-rich protein 1 [Echinococcus granulosus]CDS23284.1 protein MICAL 3 [Echinococcus granulosus]